MINSNSLHSSNRTGPSRLEVWGFSHKYTYKRVFSYVLLIAAAYLPHFMAEEVDVLATATSCYHLTICSNWSRPDTGSLCELQCTSSPCEHTDMAGARIRLTHCLRCPLVSCASLSLSSSSLSSDIIVI